jgi:hypothetical protein
MKILMAVERAPATALKTLDYLLYRVKSTELDEVALASVIAD